MSRISSLMLCLLMGMLGGIATMQFYARYSGMVTVIAVVLVVLLLVGRWRLWRYVGGRRRSLIVWRPSPVPTRATRPTRSKSEAPGRK